MPTLLSQLEAECNNLSRKVRFEYVGDLSEANANILDKLSKGDLPVCLILAFDITDGDRSGVRVNSTAEINALFLDAVYQQTIDKPTAEMEARIIGPMRTLAREWINRLDLNDIINGLGIESVTHRNTWEAVGDAHLMGDWCNFTIKFSEDTTTCLE
jgi:hypothetical protein